MFRLFELTSKVTLCSHIVFVAQYTLALGRTFHMELTS